MRLLLIEDDTMIGENIQDVLRGEGYAVDWAQDGRAGELALVHDVYDLVLLDLGLPKKDGIRVLQTYRANGGKNPVMILTARDSVMDRIGGLDAGADDYLVKPFDVKELAARVRALLRRSSGATQLIYRHRQLMLDPVSHEASHAQQVLNLAPREFALLHALIAEPQRVFSRAELEEKLYGWGDEIESNTIEVYIYGLRKKIGAGEILNVRGVGYRLAS
jgi:two-component system, OmpR family, response regulator QseB